MYVPICLLGVCIYVFVYVLFHILYSFFLCVLKNAKETMFTWLIHLHFTVVCDTVGRIWKTALAKRWTFLIVRWHIYVAKATTTTVCTAYTQLFPMGDKTMPFAQITLTNIFTHILCISQATLWLWNDLYPLVGGYVCVCDSLTNTSPIFIS